ncbi:hypothetical protein [Nostoc sp.]|uniref:hypothetical protein n=1 Tax=Nostoc sp. TaxID=1180 RepID=UPI002FF908E6
MNIVVPDLVRYVFKVTNLSKKDLSVPQLLKKRYMLSAIAPNAPNIVALWLKVKSDVHDGLHLCPFCVTKY